MGSISHSHDFKRVHLDTIDPQMASLHTVVDMAYTPEAEANSSKKMQGLFIVVLLLSPFNCFPTVSTQPLSGY